MIIVMGVTGTGKSSFLKLLTGNEAIQTSDSECCTTDVQGYQADVPLNDTTYRVTFVDTPGFDDDRTGRDDASILKDVSRWLARAYQNQIKVVGVIYLRRITDERPTGAMKRSLKILHEMIGKDNLAIAHMVTNRWEQVASGDQEKADRREQKLLSKDQNWYRLFSAYGAGYSRHDGTYASATYIIRKILQNSPAYLQIQMQLVDKKMALGDTPAGKVVICDLEEESRMVRNDIAVVEEEIIAEPEKSEHKEEEQKLRERLESLNTEKVELETESNESFMRSAKGIGCVFVCGIIIGVGVAVMPASVAMNAAVVVVAIARKPSIERLC
ncbi:hypothetical protein L211DRAFT_793475 [Terfezia boudieri ATCC MYA-4762]|uniref:G domain-containing protein n=1 Tax=Terfezia boudieri ATCC MYA-4762 TaxID=1051890 RepID=A0A3N4LEA0_9PEZI|nr:hypothetical protein L211DRAFT_793475 [Terfezia boudieri ATCC MYA-4762]